MNELESYDAGYFPEKSLGRRPGPEVLPDGTYDCEILKAELARTEKQQELICRLDLRVIAGGNGHVGTEIERVYFFRRQDQVNRLGGDLLTLGLDADRWTAQNGRRFSIELPKQLPRLEGKRFRARKSSKQNENGEWAHYLNIDSLVASTALSRNRPAAPSAVGYEAIPAREEDIPF